MVVLIKIILAHLIGDFFLQPESWVKEKEQKKALSPKLYLHALIHGLLIILVFFDLNLWRLALTIAGVHLIIDITKIYFKREKTQVWWFVTDQFLHFLSLILIWIYWFNPEINIADYLHNQKLWIHFTAAMFLSYPSGIIIKVLLINWSRNLSDGTNASLADAGKYIGILERLFVYLFIITGHWEAVGFLLAAKSVFRFGDLKESRDRKLTEYILIGTLLSFGFAIATGVAVDYLNSK